MWPFNRKSKKEPTSVPSAGRRRNYAAAANEARYGDFRRSKGSADYELMIGLSALRERSRALDRNSATMGRYIQLMQDNVIGESGLQYRCTVRRADDKLDKVTNTRAENEWWRFMRKPTVDGIMSGVDFQRQAVGTWARDGEYLVELVYNDRYEQGFALNPLEADMLDETLNTVHPPTGNQIRMGVEVDSYGRPVAYHLLMSHPGDPGWYMTRSEKKHRRVEASRIIHVFERRRPGQTRGEPPASRIINSVKMLDGYREAEVTGRRIASSVMGFFRRDAPAASQIDALGVKDPDTGSFELELRPGTLKQLPDGMSFDKFEASGSTVDYAQFESAVKRDISMGLSISAFSLGMETAAVSFSTGRSVLLEDRDHYRAIQRFFIDNLMEAIHEHWLNHLSLRDNSPIAPTKIALIRNGHLFRGRGWDWVDPAKDVKANAEALRTRQTSLSRIAAQRGLDFADLIAEIAADEATLADAGLSITFKEGSTDDDDTNDSGDDNDDGPDPRE